MCCWKKRVQEKPVEKDSKLETENIIGEESTTNEKGNSFTPEELESLRRKYPEQIPFTPQWKIWVQAENARKTGEDTGLIH